MAGGQIMDERVWCCVLYDSPHYTFLSTKIVVRLVTVPISCSIRWVLGPPACLPAPVPYRWAMEVQLPLGCLRAVDQVWVHPVACITTLEWDHPWAHHLQVTTIQGWVLHHLVVQAWAWVLPHRPAPQVGPLDQWWSLHPPAFLQQWLPAHPPLSQTATYTMMVPVPCPHHPPPPTLTPLTTQCLVAVMRLTWAVHRIHRTTTASPTPQVVSFITCVFAQLVDLICMLNVIEVGCQVAGTAPTNVTPAAPGSVTSVVTTGPDGAPLDEGSQQSTLSNASAGMMSVLSAVNWLLTNMPFVWAFRAQIVSSCDSSQVGMKWKSFMVKISLW